MKRAAYTFGATFALLLAVALSVPVGPADARGYSPTMLQWGTPFVIALVVLVGALVLVCKLFLASLRDRRDERRTIERIVQHQNLAYQASLHLLVGVTAQQAALVQQALALGASLVQERDQYYAQLPGASGPRFPLDVVEAEYWQELEGRTESGGRRTEKKSRNSPPSSALILPSSRKGGW